MWIVAIGLTIFFWLVLDNILVGAMLAIFAIFLFSISRALLKLREQQKMEKASLEKQGDQTETPLATELEIDDSYLSLVGEQNDGSALGAEDKINRRHGVDSGTVKNR